MSDAPNIFEKAINTSGKSVNKLNKQIDQIFNGTRKYTMAQLKGVSVPERLADIGVIGVIDTIAGIDMCQLLSYISDVLIASNGYKFDPNVQPPDGSSTITRKAWLLQSSAYSIKQQIDQFNATNGQRVNVNDLAALLPNIVNELTYLLNPKIEGSIVDKDLQKAFSVISVIANYVNIVLNVLNTYVSFQGSAQNVLLQINPNGGTIGTTGAGQTQSQISQDYKKILGFLNNLDTACAQILKIDIYNPLGVSSLTSLVTSVANPQIQRYIAQLNGIIGNDLQKLVPLLENLQNQCVGIQRYCSLILSTVRTLQIYTKIGAILMKVFTAVVNFLKSLPIPNQFTVVGINVRFSDSLQSIQNLITRVTQDLSAINNLLSKVSTLISNISSDINKINQALTILITNLQSCNNAPPGLVDNLKNTQSQLNDAANQLNAFVQNSQNKINNNNLTYGGYTIQIITEQLLQTSTNIPRRYGVALDSDGIEVVKSTPTFATLDNIIIEEVQLLLESKKLVQPTQSSLSQSQLSTLKQSLSYLEDNTAPEDFSSNINIPLDSANNLDENSGLGLNAFVNNQKGGTALRDRMRSAMSSASFQLQQNLATANQG